MTVYVFGNEDAAEDSLPIRILPELRKKFPRIKFEVKDPNEEWANSSSSEEDERPNQTPFGFRKPLVIIDTAVGLKDVKIFDSLEKFAPAPRVGMHDFDALANLRFLKKLGRLPKIKIIAVPPEMSEAEATKKIVEVLESF